MDEYVDRVGAERLWAVTLVAATAAVALAAWLFPQRVYVEIIWQYYWGPVVADARNLSCVAWDGGAQVPCGPGTAGPEASPGYTFVSYAGYVPTLIFLLIGFLFVVRRLEIDRYRAGFWGLFPFMLFGGALRTVEDANVAVADAGIEPVISLPWSALIISPFIYAVVAVVALASLVVSVLLERRGYVSGYEYPLAGFGTAGLAVALALLVYLSRVAGADFFPLIAVTVLAGATVVTAVAWGAIERFAPALNAGTRYTGIVVIWAHSVDGIANLVGLDYATAFGWPQNLSPKHPINAAIVDTFGTAWPFVFLKVAVAVAIVWLFDDEFFEESPRVAVLLLITVVAVGLGPGTRDMLRATFGV